MGGRWVQGFSDRKKRLAFGFVLEYRAASDSPVRLAILDTLMARQVALGHASRAWNWKQSTVVCTHVLAACFAMLLLERLLKIGSVLIVRIVCLDVSSSRSLATSSTCFK